MKSLAKIPFHGTTLHAYEGNGTQWVALRPICESLGIQADAQLKRLKREPWATTSIMDGVGADGKNREITFVDRRTFTMWLATIQTSRVQNDAARALLIAFQTEAADALDKYFHDGGAINPNADEHQLNALVRRAQMNMELLQAARGLIDPKHLEAKARVELARGLGELPQLDPGTRPLYTQDFLKTKNLSKSRMKSVAGTFGKRVKAAYTLEYGREPGKYPLNLANGQTRDVCAYTEADRALMERIWATYYAKTATA